MSKGKRTQVCVALEKSQWEAVTSIILLECQRRGGDWLRWGKSVSAAIETAIQSEINRALTDCETLYPFDSETNSGEKPGGPRHKPEAVDNSDGVCPDCGGPLYYTFTNELMAWHEYTCGSCANVQYIEMSRNEMMERGDFSFLEDWERGMEDNL